MRGLDYLNGLYLAYTQPLVARFAAYTQPHQTSDVPGSRKTQTGANPDWDILFSLEDIRPNGAQARDALAEKVRALLQHARTVSSR